MKVVRTVAAAREALEPVRAGSELGLVPTMGALHAGHVSLFEAARRENDVVVASVFVNPAQFDEQADLDAYSRDQQRDIEVADQAGVDLLFAPSAEDIYPAGFQTWAEVGETAQGGEGSARPGHFRAVATVCLKLFNIVRPTRAYFGQKDAQQAAVVRRLVRDLDLELEVRVLPIVRDPDGLALSSRNQRLSREERERALTLPGALATGREAYAAGMDPIAATRAALDGLDPDYVELLDLDGATVLTAAVRIGATRLIDNVIVKGALP